MYNYSRVSARMRKGMNTIAKEREQLENARQENIAKQEFQENAVQLGGGGSESYQGTGWGSFKQLVEAQRKKFGNESFQQRQIGNFAQLLGSNRTLG